MEEWKTYKLGDVLTVKYGKDHKHLADGNIPIYGSGGIMRYGERSLFEGPSILIPRKGSLNNVMYADSPFWTVDTMFWTIINEDIVNPLFVYYAICKKDWASLNVGSAVPSLTVPVIEDIEINLPPKNVQDNISNILKSLDDKIEVNRRLNDNLDYQTFVAILDRLSWLKRQNDNLEQQAQALFKSWFVDFEPFKNGEFVESELGMIPAGFEIKPLGELPLIVTDYVANGSFASLKENVRLYEEENYAYFIRNTDLKSRDFCVYVDKHSYDFLSKSKLEGGEIIISNVGDVGSVHLCPRLDKPMTLGNNIIMLKSLQKGYRNYLYVLFKWSYGQDLIQSIKGGSAQPKFNKTDFKSLRIIMPNQKNLYSFDMLTTPIFDNIDKNDEEIKHLARLRDSLLPQLMSGELKIREMNA